MSLEEQQNRHKFIRDSIFASIKRSSYVISSGEILTIFPTNEVILTILANEEVYSVEEFDGEIRFFNKRDIIVEPFNVETIKIDMQDEEVDEGNFNTIVDCQMGPVTRTLKVNTIYRANVKPITAFETNLNTTQFDLIKYVKFDMLTLNIPQIGRAHV